ncbi:MAG: hypothetical protein ACKN9V_03105, partial [Pseudomonadota bacterium]
EDFSEALSGLKRSIAQVFTPEAALVAALVNLRLEGDLDSSLDNILSAEAVIEGKIKERGLNIYPPEYFEILLYQARIYDLKGLSGRAQSIYSKIAQHSSLKDPGIFKLATKAKPYSKRRLKRLIMPYSTYIPFD